MRPAVFFLLALWLVGCAAPTPLAPSAQKTPTALVYPTAQLATPHVIVQPTATPPGERCALLVAVCWDTAEQAMVAHICYEEARGLEMAGMASCAATIAMRQVQPHLWGSSDLAALLSPDQFAVKAARLRPWEQQIPPPQSALDSVQLFLTNTVEVGCWRFDSFQASTPNQARQWLKRAPEKHCVVIVEPQAMLFFNWRDG